MKTLVNNNNPQIRITVPEIDRVCLSTGDDTYNVFIVKQWPLNSLVFFDTDWTLVEEEPDVNFKVKERKWVHDAVDSVFPEDGDFMSEVDFRKILKETAHYFYELGLNARKEK